MAKRQLNTTPTEIDFEDSMQLTAEHVRQPKNYPEGPWVIQNVGFSTSEVEDERRGRQLKVNLRYNGFEPGVEVDPDAVQEGGYEGKTLWVARYISLPAAKAAIDGTLARFINFTAMHGVDTDGRTVEDLCKALKGENIQAHLGTRTYTNREGDEVIDNTVSDFAPLS